MADLDKAIRLGQQAVTATPEDHPGRAGRLSILGNQLGNRYSRTGAMSDLHEAIRLGQQAVRATPEDHPNRAGYLSNLGDRLGDRYSRTGAMADLDEAIQFGQQAVRATPEDHPDRAGFLSNLGDRLGDRYSRTGAMADLDEAIQFGQQAVTATPEDHPNHAGFLSKLGVRLGNRYLRTGAMADLDEAIQLGQQVVTATPEDHPGRAGCLSILGHRLGERYLRTGAMADLDKAIQLGQQAVTATPEDHPDRAGRLSILGNQLGNRYSRTGAMADLHEAIRLGQQAVRATPEDHPNRAGYLSNLGNHLGDRYSRTGAMADLDKAIQLGQQAVTAIWEDHLGRAGCLSNLGNRLSDRYSRTGAMADLDEAIQLGQQAVTAIPEDHLGRAWCLSNLGNQLGKRYSRTGAMADLNEAIQLGQQVVRATPEDHPNRAMYLSKLGDRLGDRYLRTGAMADLEEAISYHQSALCQLTSSTISRITAGREVLKCCAIFSDWQQAYKAADIAVHLIPKLTSRSLENSDKQHMLGQVVGLASDAAAAALYVEKGPLVALDFLEQGRGVLAASLEEMQTDILYLQGRYPELADQFIRLRNELELPLTRNTTFIDENRESAWQVQPSRRYEAGNALDQLIVEIREKPEFHDFLLAPSREELQASAKYGPVVVINVSKYRCDAILVEQHQIRSLALRSLDSEDIKEKAQGNDLGNPKVLEWLWDVIANPILDALGFTQPPPKDKWPHVWWIPTGALSKFPLHAAGYHTKGSSETVLDRVMSSYGTSVKAIIHSRQRPIASSASTKALLVAMEDTPGKARLPFATKEVAILHGLCKSMAMEPVEPQRHKQAVISHLPQCKIFHFAGHGHSDKDDPSENYLLLGEENADPLTVATLLQMNIRQQSPFLAYLSACGTGRLKDEKFADESVHLISACQLAGFRHVIGTLWEVNDELCVDMARITYEGMRDGGMTDESMCRGLHNATRELRDQWQNMQAKARRGSRLVRKADLFWAEDKTEAWIAGDGSPRDDILPRDVVLCDDDDNKEGIGSLHWVPYVHFGV